MARICLVCGKIHSYNNIECLTKQNQTLEGRIKELESLIEKKAGIHHAHKHRPHLPDIIGTDLNGNPLSSRVRR